MLYDCRKGLQRLLQRRLLQLCQFQNRQRRLVDQLKKFFAVFFKQIHKFTIIKITRFFVCFFPYKKSSFFKIIKIPFFFRLDGFLTSTAPKLPKSRSVSRTSSTSGPFHQDYAEIVDEDADYSSPSRDFELDRECVHLSQILGQGQFGDVYGGFYSHPTGGQDDIHVAVKTCKLEADESTAEKILEEACKIFNTQWGKKSQFQKFTCAKSHFQIRIFHKNLSFKIAFFTKITFSKSHFSQKSHFIC